MTAAQDAIRKALAEVESVGERTLRAQLVARGIRFIQEAQAIPGRRYRFDFLLLDARVLVEVQGGVFSRSRKGHAHPLNVVRDIEKAALAAANGYRLVPCTTDDVKDGRAIRWVVDALAWRP